MSPEGSVAAVIFDFGNVVVRWSMPALFSEFFDDPADMDRFLSEVLTPAENLRCDLGTPLAEIVDELISAHPHHEKPLTAWRDRWIDTLPGPVTGTEELIDDLLAGGYGVYGLSNFSAETFPWAVERYPVFHRFHGIVLSGEEGVAKPDPAIYTTLTERYGLDIGSCVFMDDSPANVAGAHEVGMAAFLFTDTNSARATLREQYGVRV